MISAMDWRLWMSFSKPKMASWTGLIRTLVLKETNLYAWVVPKTSLRRVLYFPMANMFDFNEQTKQPILTFLSRIADPILSLTTVPTRLTNLSIPREIAHLNRSNWASIPAGLSTLAAVVEHCGKSRYASDFWRKYLQGGHLYDQLPWGPQTSRGRPPPGDLPLHIYHPDIVYHITAIIWNALLGPIWKPSTCPNSGSFPPAVRHFSLQYTKYSCGKMTSSDEKSLAVGHISGFQIDPKEIV